MTNNVLKTYKSKTFKAIQFDGTSESFYEIKKLVNDGELFYRATYDSKIVSNSNTNPKRQVNCEYHNVEIKTPTYGFSINKGDYIVEIKPGVFGKCSKEFIDELCEEIKDE